MRWPWLADPDDPPDPIEAIRFRMDQSGLGIAADSLITQHQENGERA